MQWISTIVTARIREQVAPLDTSELTFGEQVDRIVTLARSVLSD